MPSVLPAWIPDLDDLKKSVARCPHCGSRGLLHLAHVSTSIDARIKRCWKLSTQAHTQAELDSWRAEEEGLQDAVLERDHMDQYRERPAAVFERYAMGVEDGKALSRLACMDAQRTPSVQPDTGVIQDSSKRPNGTGRATLVSLRVQRHGWRDFLWRPHDAFHGTAGSAEIGFIISGVASSPTSSPPS